MLQVQGRARRLHAHYIRESVLCELILERIRTVNEYIRDDAEGFQEEWLQCQRVDQEKSIREDKKRLEKAQKRLSDLDAILSHLYEDYVFGNISLERYKKMSADYEAEQEQLKQKIEVLSDLVQQRESEDENIDRFMALYRKYIDVPELTPSIVNEYIQKIIVYAPDKSTGTRRQKLKLIFNFTDNIKIPVLSAPIIEESPRKWA